MSSKSLDFATHNLPVSYGRDNFSPQLKAVSRRSPVTSNNFVVSLSSRGRWLQISKWEMDNFFHFSGGFGSDAGSSAGDSLGRPDSLGPVDDDEDRIPEELLLKYVVSKCMYLYKHL